MDADEWLKETAIAGKGTNVHLPPKIHGLSTALFILSTLL